MLALRFPSKFHGGNRGFGLLFNALTLMESHWGRVFYCLMCFDFNPKRSSAFMRSPLSHFINRNRVWYSCLPLLKLFFSVLAVGEGFCIVFNRCLKLISTKSEAPFFNLVFRSQLGSFVFTWMEELWSKMKGFGDERVMEYSRNGSSKDLNDAF